MLVLEVRKIVGEGNIQMHKLQSSVLEKLLKQLFVTLKCNFGTESIGKSWGFDLQL